MKVLSTKRKREGDHHVSVLNLESALCLADEEDRKTYLERIAESRAPSAWYRFLMQTKHSDLPSTMTFHQQTAETDQEKAQVLSDFFSSVYVQSSYCNSHNLVHDELPTITDFDCSQERVKTIIDSLDPTKACGMDAIPAVVLKNVSATIAKSLSQLFNKIKQTCRFPDAWKIGVITAIHKKGSKVSVTNYRPVSLLSIVSKILERCIFLDLYAFLEPLFTPAQYGFRKGRSSVLQLLTFLNQIYRSIEEGKSVDVIYTDFEKAFDKVDHGILLKKLWRLGVRRKLWKLIRSYLSYRRQAVRVGESLSGYTNVTSGVPQGSILGPLFFLVMINDLPGEFVNDTLICADDTKIVSLSGKGLQKDSSKLECWCEENQMKLNADKCIHLRFNAKEMMLTPLSLYSQNLVTQSSHTDLGILFCSSLKWDDHILEKLAKANRSFHAVRRNAYGISPKAKINVYKTCILPIITYASQCWYASIGSLRRMELFQRKILRWCYGEKATRDCHLAANILPISLYLQLADLLFLSNASSSQWKIRF
ncbi:MAG: reverse transcriptase family protein [Bacteroidota bacterium]